MRLNIKYLEIALAHAHANGYEAKGLPLEEAIEAFFKIPRIERKKDFEGAIERVLKHIAENERKGYKCALGKYMSQFPREKANKGWIPQVLEANAFRVVMQIYPELKATFYPATQAAKKAQLGWKDVNVTKEVLSGSSKIGDATFLKAKRQAVAILNKYRKPVAQIAA